MKRNVSSDGSFSSVFLSEGLNRLSLEVFVWNLTRPSSVIEEVVARQSHSCWCWWSVIGAPSSPDVTSRLWSLFYCPRQDSETISGNFHVPIYPPARAAIFSNELEVFQHGSFWNCNFGGFYLEKRRHGKKQTCSVFSSAALDPFRSEDSCLDSRFLWYLCRCSAVRSLNIIRVFSCSYTSKKLFVFAMRWRLWRQIFLLDPAFPGCRVAESVEEMPPVSKRVGSRTKTWRGFCGSRCAITPSSLSALTSLSWGKKLGEERSFWKRAQGTSHSRLGGCRTLICLLWHRQRTVDELWPLSTQQAFVSECERDQNLASVTIWTFAFICSPKIWPSMIHII